VTEIIRYDAKLLIGAAPDKSQVAGKWKFRLGV